jgi:hypothetical protein
VDIILIICIRLTLNNSGVLNGVIKVKNILFNIVINNIKVIEIEFKRVPLEFKEIRLV